MNILKNLVFGIDIPPFIVGIVRGAIETAVMAGLGFVAVEASTLDWGQYAAFTPGILWGIRSLEGLADNFIDPTQNR